MYSFITVVIVIIINFYIYAGASWSLPYNLFLPQMNKKGCASKETGAVLVGGISI